MGILLGLLPYLAAGIALYGAYEGVQHWCNKACTNAEAKTEAVAAEFAEYKADAARKIAALATLWDQKRQESEHHAQAAEAERAKTFAALEEKARAMGRAGHIVISDNARKLFDDAAAAAAAASAGPAAKPAEAASAPAESAESYIVQLYRWGAEGWARVTEWELFYDGVQYGIPRSD